MPKKQALDLDLSLASFSNDVVENGTHERHEESALLQDFHGVAASIGLVRFQTSNFKLGMLLLAGTTREVKKFIFNQLKIEIFFNELLLTQI